MLSRLSTMNPFKTVTPSSGFVFGNQVSTIHSNINILTTTNNTSPFIPSIFGKNCFATSTPAQKVPQIDTSFTLDPRIKHLAEIHMRSERRMLLKEAVLNQNKNVIWADIRKPNDKILELKQQGKCVGVIKRHPSKLTVPGQEPQIDFVTKAKPIRGMRKNSNNGLMGVYVRAGDQEYRCVLSRICMHFEGWVERVELDEYVPEQPNPLTIPLEITHITENPYLQQGGEFEIKRENIDIICYNHEYPLKFFVDSSFACPERSYRVGDLANTFPPGIILAPDMYPNQRILQIKARKVYQGHMKQKIMKSYLSSNKKQKTAPTPAAGAATTNAQKK